MDIKKVHPSKVSQLQLSRYDYVDSYAASLKSINCKHIDVNTLLKAMIKTTPNWIFFLLKIRDKCVAKLGLKINNHSYSKKDLSSKINVMFLKQLDDIDVEEYEGKELIISMADNHLDFWSSLLIQDSENNVSVTFTTYVLFNNMFGRIYFFIIKPFHKMIIKSLLKNSMRQFL